MNILITGAKGMLGGDLVNIFNEEHRVFGTDIDDMDVRNLEMVRNKVADYKPDLIIHLAALTDVDFCEREPKKAFYTNTVGTQNIALACQIYEIPMVYVSTLSVFDGTKPEPYHEFDQPNPKSHYSQSKYQGEVIVRSLLKKYYIVRAGWMFGGAKQDKKFVAKIFNLLQTRSELKGVNDKFGSPTYTIDISRAIMNLIKTNRYGIYHLVNTGEPVSRYGVAEMILKYAGITSCELSSVSSAEFPLSAPRPRMEAGINLASELIGLHPMRHWHDALNEYIQTNFLESDND